MTTTTAGDFREQLLGLLASDRTDEFLSHAPNYLHQCADDHHVRLMVVREYLKLGLISPAQELLGSGAASGELHQELASVRDAVQDIRAEPAGWSTTDARFQRNLAALRARGIDADAIEAAWHKASDLFELHVDRRGREQVRMQDAHGSWRWVPRLADHRQVAESQALPPDAAAPVPGPYLFEGVDLGCYFERVYRATKHTYLGFSCALFVVEPDAAVFALALRLRDWEEPIADERTFWFVGDGAVDRLVRIWDDNPNLPWPQHAFQMSAFRRTGSPGAIERVRAAAERLEQTVRRSWDELEQRYRNRDAAYWARRFDEALSGRGEPLRILASVSMHTTFLQYSMRDARRALESLGHRCVVLMERAPFEILSPRTHHAAIRDLDPDVFLNIDHLRPEFAGIVPENLPVLTWDQDQLPQVFTRKNIEGVGPLDFVVGCSKSRCLLLGGRREQFRQVQIPTCPEQFGGDPLTDEEMRRYACDVSYVSHASQTARAFHDEQKASCGDAKLAGLLDVLYELMPPALHEHHVMGGELALALIEDASRRCGVVVRDQEVINWLRGWYLWRLGDRWFRHEALEWVAQWARRTGASFRIYGNGWERHPSLSDYAAGSAGNGRELLCVYRASKINLQLMPAGFIHQRALDGLAAGGFFLARRTPNDMRGRTLRELIARIDELKIETTAELIESTDEVLRRLMHAYGGEWSHRAGRDASDLMDNLRIAAEILHPDELFPDFEEVVFDSADGFASRADRFLADEEARRRRTERMRAVVVERFSYRPTMERFLRAMGDYLKLAAGGV